MPTPDAALRLAADAMSAASEDALVDILLEACRRMGCSWFALTHHIDFLAAPEKGVRITNYPEDWARWFDERGLGTSDPVHRASHRRMAGFLWHDMTNFSAARPGDEAILARARRHGIHDGLTVPAHLPGEAHGSVSFAWRHGAPASPEALFFAQTIAGFAFEAARQLSAPLETGARPRLIAASLVTGLNSDVPGLVVAQVTENVHDSITGRVLLIPQGARLVGRYDDRTAFGQRRARVIWQRIIWPDGSSLRIGDVPASDATGQAGLADSVDLHSGSLLKGVALSTLLGAGTEFGFGGEESELVRALRQSAQQNGARAGDRLVDRHLDIPPTIRVRPGWPLRVIVHQDLILKPWRV